MPPTWSWFGTRGRRSPPDGRPLLLDRYLPVFHFREIHTIQIAATPARIFRAIKEVTLGEIPLAGALFWVRALPARLAGRRVGAFRGGTPFLEQALDPAGGFVLLGEAMDRELVIGTVGQFWKVLGGSYPRPDDAEEFLAFDHPAHAKAALNFLIEPDQAGRYRLRTETRVFAASPAARRRFAAYWRLIHPGSAVLRRLWLRAIKRRAERGSEHRLQQERHRRGDEGADGEGQHPRRDDLHPHPPAHG